MDVNHDINIIPYIYNDYKTIFILNSAEHEIYHAENVNASILIFISICVFNGIHCTNMLS